LEESDVVKAGLRRSWSGAGSPVRGPSFFNVSTAPNGHVVRRGRYYVEGWWAPQRLSARAWIDNALFTPGKPTATFRCDAPARCGAFTDERRVVAGDEGGRVWTLIQSPWL